MLIRSQNPCRKQKKRAATLMDLTRHDAEFIWSEKCDKAFKHLKEFLI